MPYYEYEITVEELTDILKKKNDNEKSAQAEAEKAQKQMKAPGINNLGKGMNMKMPKMPTVKMPKI
jgi:hypothetical protein